MIRSLIQLFFFVFVSFVSCMQQQDIDLLLSYERDNCSIREELANIYKKYPERDMRAKMRLNLNRRFTENSQKQKELVKKLLRSSELAKL